MIRLGLPRSVGGSFQGGRHGGRQGWRRQFPARFDLLQPPVELIIPARHHLELLDQRLVLLGQLRILLLETLQAGSELLDRDRGSFRRGCVGAVAPLGRSGCLALTEGSRRDRSKRKPAAIHTLESRESLRARQHPWMNQAKEGIRPLSWSVEWKAGNSVGQSSRGDWLEKPLLARR